MPAPGSPDPAPSRATPAPTIPTTRECRIRASLLLKALRSGDDERANSAAARFRVLPRFAALGPDRIAAWADSVQRKHALAVVARELGFDSWITLRDAAERAHPAAAANVERLFDEHAVFHLNHWCSTYDEARHVRELTDGFLFPYRAQFVVCAAGLLEWRGLDPHDPDWQRIGRDWVRPRDARAFERLSRRLVASGFGGS